MLLPIPSRAPIGAAASLVACLLLWDTRAAHAQQARDFGLGLIIGDPTGVSGKYFVSTEFAIDSAVGLGLIGGDHLHVHVDVLWHFEIERWSSAQTWRSAGGTGSERSADRRVLEPLCSRPHGLVGAFFSSTAG